MKETPVSLSFSLVALTALLVIAVGTGSEDCRKEVFLLTVTNTALQEVTVSLLSQDDERSPADPSTLRIPGRRLPEECGPLNLRCRELLVVQTTEKGETHFAVLAPLADGILIAALRRSASEKKLVIASHHIIDVFIGCSPTAMFKLSGDIFVICVNQSRHYVTALQVYLNTTAVQNSLIDGPLINFNGLRDPANLSDFESVNLRQSFYEKKVYFATGNILYSLTPESYYYNYVGRLGNCLHVQSLVYSRDYVLLAYCSESIVYFDIDSENLFNETKLSEGGWPAVCSDQDIHLQVYQSASGFYAVYGAWSRNSLANFNMQGTEFDSGVCFGVGEDALFVYGDRSEGVFVQELFSEDPVASLHKLSTVGCGDEGCKHLRVFQDRYIAFQTGTGNDAAVAVVDAKNPSSSALISEDHFSPDLLALLVDPSPPSCVSPTQTFSTVTPTPPPSVSTSLSVAVMVAIGVISPIGVILPALVLIIGVIYYHYHKRKRREREPLAPIEAVVQDGSNAYTGRTTAQVVNQNSNPVQTTDDSKPVQTTDDVQPMIVREANGTVQAVNCTSVSTTNSQTPLYMYKDEYPQLIPYLDTLGENGESPQGSHTATATSAPLNPPAPLNRHTLPQANAVLFSTTYPDSNTERFELATILKRTPSTHPPPQLPPNLPQVPQLPPNGADPVTTQQQIPSLQLTADSGDQSFAGDDESRKSSTSSSNSAAAADPQEVMEVEESGYDMEEEEDSTREDHSSDQLLPGNFRQVPRRKVLHTAHHRLRRNRERRKSPPKDPKDAETRNLEMQLVNDELDQS